ncbi:hypothetical protein Q8F55_001668 [Vanrija albida]|uniref:F-box domain-containing protein n=1 Tax=Vanrija albida TaxID=181172 RepID=A0ABR3Q7L4_9TREE
MSLHAHDAHHGGRDAGHALTDTALPAPRNPLDLGIDIFLVVASLLDPEDLVAASQVCRAWRETLSISAAPWRVSCVRAQADEWDRVEAVRTALEADGEMLDPAAVAQREVRRWRELALIHARTERCWTTGPLNKTVMELDFAYEFYVDSKTGVIFTYWQGRYLLLDRKSLEPLQYLPFQEWGNLHFVNGCHTFTVNEVTQAGRLSRVSHSTLSLGPLSSLKTISPPQFARHRLVPSSTAEGAIFVEGAIFGSHIHLYTPAFVKLFEIQYPQNAPGALPEPLDAPEDSAGTDTSEPQPSVTDSTTAGNTSGPSDAAGPAVEGIIARTAFATESPKNPMTLGPDVFLLIASTLDPTDLITASQVCAAWRAAHLSNSLPWRHSCLAVDADEADRIEAIPEWTGEGVGAEVHKWRELCFMHAESIRLGVLAGLRRGSTGSPSPLHSAIGFPWTRRTV